MTTGEKKAEKILSLAMKQSESEDLVSIFFKMHPDQLAALLGLSPKAAVVVLKSIKHENDRREIERQQTIETVKGAVEATVAKTEAVIGMASSAASDLVSRVGKLVANKSAKFDHNAETFKKNRDKYSLF